MREESEITRENEIAFIWVCSKKVMLPTASRSKSLKVKWKTDGEIKVLIKKDLREIKLR